MTDRVTVTEPMTGVRITVLADSPQAKVWGAATESEKKPARRTAKKSAAKKSN